MQPTGSTAAEHVIGDRRVVRPDSLEYPDMAIDVDRGTLHTLVEALRPESLAHAREMLEPLADPVLLALLTAPAEDEELSDDEVAALDALEAERAAGTPIAYVTDAELARRIGG